VFAVELSDEGAGVAFAVDFLSDDAHVHFWEFALGAADVLFDELVQHFPEVFLAEIAVDDVVGVVLAPGLLEGRGGGLFEAEEF
jgi:hypothetical protein